MPGDVFPVLTTRLRLRRFQEKDLAAFVAYRSDPEIVRFQSWSSVTPDEARAFIREQQQARFGVPGEWFQIAVAERESDRLIGDVGVCVRAEDPTGAEIGFTISRVSQGKGFASEAVRATLTILFDTTGVECVEAITDSRNAASIGLLRKLGMRQAKSEDAWFKGSTCIEYSFVMRKKDWTARKAV